jgi:putative transposase
VADKEAEARKEAVGRVLAGESPASVAADLGRTDRWVRKWVARFDPANDAWAADRSRAPREQPRRTSPGTERLVLEIRERLMADPWAQVGAVAIAWELEKLGISPPAVWTIDRILRRAGSPSPGARTRYVPKGTAYPTGSAPVGPNAVHQIDLVGPRHLEGGLPFHALNAVDVGTHRVGIEILPSKQEHQVAEGLIRVWDRLGVPKVAQFDNGQTIVGRGRHLALPVRVCLTLGARARLIPFGEPWRNAVVEHFNDTFDKRFFRIERFRDLSHLTQRVAAFEVFHNTHQPLLGAEGRHAGRVGCPHRVHPGAARGDVPPARPDPCPRPRRVHPVDPLRSDPQGARWIEARPARGTRLPLRHGCPGRAHRVARRHL